MLGNEKELCFSVAMNKYEKPTRNDLVTPGALFYDDEGKLIDSVTFT